MRACLAVLTLFGVVVARQGQDENVETAYVPMWEVYGSSPHVNYSRAAVRRSRLSAANRESCTFPFEILFLQDASGSFTSEYWDQMANALPELVNFLIQDHPGSTLSLVSYSDKPIESLGELNDYCWNTEVTAAADLDSISKAYKQIVGGGGYDWPENQFGALVAAVSSPETIPWRQNPQAIRVVVQITDAGPHYHQDAEHALYKSMMEDFPDAYVEAQAEDFCLKKYYPDPVWTAEKVMEEGVYVATMVVRYEEHAELAYRSWVWFNGLLNQSDSFVRGVEEDPATWLTDIVDLFADVRNEACGITTTPAPSSLTSASSTLSAHEASASASGTASIGTSGSLAAGTSGSLAAGTHATSAAGTHATSAATPAATTSEECVCAPTNTTGPCCQPEVLIQLRRRPREFDLHLVN